MLKKGFTILGCGLIILLLLGAIIQNLVEKLENEMISSSSFLIDIQTKGNIFGSTIYLTMFEIGDAESESQTETVNAVVNEGLGTLMLHNQEHLIITHIN